MSRTLDPALLIRRRHRVVLAALACFKRAGIHKTGIADICAEAKMSPGHVYRVFESKDAVIAAAAKEFARKQSRQLRLLLRTGPPRHAHAAFMLWAENFVRLESKDARVEAALEAEFTSEAIRSPNITDAPTVASRTTILAQTIAEWRALEIIQSDLDPNLSSIAILGALGALRNSLLMCAVIDAETAPAKTRAILHRYLS